MRVTIAQINTTPNDFEGNYNKIFNGIAAAVRENADVVVFPELTIPGYLVKDLVYTTRFIEKNLETLYRVAQLTKGTNVTVIVGYIDRNTTGVGKPFRNMAAVARNGVVTHTYQKHLLPFYDVFDEGRYFEPGTETCVFEINGNRCGIVICEDAWNDKSQDDYCYEDNPIAKYRKLGINYLFSLNSSPYARNKPKYRLSMLANITSEWNGDPLNLIYVNQIGGQDELVFDGHSCIISKGQLVAYFKNNFQPATLSERFETFEIPPNGKNGPWLDLQHENDHLQMTLLGLYDYITKSGFKSVVLGSSGGVDSALVATLATLAIGAENVNCFMMPSCYSSEGSVKHAQELHKRLGCKEYTVPINHMELINHINRCCKFTEIVDLGPIGDATPKFRQLVDYNKVADENIQARIRGQVVMYYSNAMNALALTTGNKTELATGYCTLYGDMNGGFNPIGDQYKMEIFDMCRQINKLFDNPIPEEIISKAPSAELRPDQTDEASLLPYPILDNIVKLYIENHVTDYKLYCKCTHIDIQTTEKEYNRITRLIYVSEFKRRQAAPTIKLSNVAFGTGRRLPIVKK